MSFFLGTKKRDLSDKSRDGSLTSQEMERIQRKSKKAIT